MSKIRPLQRIETVEQLKTFTASPREGDGTAPHETKHAYNTWRLYGKTVNRGTELYLSASKPTLRQRLLQDRAGNARDAVARLLDTDLDKFDSTGVYTASVLLSRALNPVKMFRNMMRDNPEQTLRAREVYDASYNLSAATTAAKTLRSAPPVATPDSSGSEENSSNTTPSPRTVSTPSGKRFVRFKDSEFSPKVQISVDDETSESGSGSLRQNNSLKPLSSWTPVKKDSEKPSNVQQRRTRDEPADEQVGPTLEQVNTLYTRKKNRESFLTVAKDANGGGFAATRKAPGGRLGKRSQLKRQNARKELKSALTLKAQPLNDLVRRPDLPPYTQEKLLQHSIAAKKTIDEATQGSMRLKGVFTSIAKVESEVRAANKLIESTARAATTDASSQPERPKQTPAERLNATGQVLAGPRGLTDENIERAEDTVHLILDKLADREQLDRLADLRLFTDFLSRSLTNTLADDAKPKLVAALNDCFFFDTTHAYYMQQRKKREASLTQSAV